MSAALKAFVLVPVFGLAVTAIGGCVVLVPAYDTDEHCRIQGDTTCAACIRTNCQADIDTCCGSADCNGMSMYTQSYATTLPDLDECGKGNATTCATKFHEAKTVTEAEAVRACLTTKCSAACLSGASVTPAEPPAWTCKTPRDAEGKCASCIYDKCQAGIDDCCSDSTCGQYSTIAKDLTLCLAGDEGGCTYRVAGSDTGLEGVVRGCIIKSCGKACLGNGLPHTTCTLQNAGSYCTCTDTEAAGTQECSVEKVGGDCVIGDGGCSCGKYGCKDTGTDKCRCDFTGGAGTDTDECRTWTGSGSEKACCVQFSGAQLSCSCGNYSCSDILGEYEIDSCDHDVVVGYLKALGRITDECSR